MKYAQTFPVSFTIIILFKKPPHTRRLLFYKFNNVGDGTIQRVAKGIQRFCADRLPLLHAVKGIRRKALLEDKAVFCYTLFQQGFVKGSVRYHFHHRNYGIILKLLTMLNI